MANISGSVSGPFNKNYTGHVIGTGDGIETEFSGTVTNVPIMLGFCTLNYWISSIEYNVASNSSGVFTDATIVAASINEAGELDAEFASPIDDTEDVTVDYRAKGLLQAVLDFVTGDAGTEGENWQIELEENSKDNSLSSPADAFSGELLKQVVLFNDGLTDAEEVYVGMREFYHTTNGEYGWDLNVYRDGWEVGNSWNVNLSTAGMSTYNTTSKRFSAIPSIVFRNAALNYWIYSNSTRIIVVVRSSTVYDCCYLGLGHRLAPASNYVNPLVCGGSCSGTSNYTTTGDTRRAFPMAYTGGSTNTQIFLVDQDNNYIRQNLSGHNLRLVPTHFWDDFNNVVAVGDMDGGGGVILCPVTVIDNSVNVTLMVLDGVFVAVSDSLAAEDTVTIDSVVYRVFQNVYRTSKFDNFLIREN